MNASVLLVISAPNLWMMAMECHRWRRKRGECFRRSMNAAQDAMRVAKVCITCFTTRLRIVHASLRLQRCQPRWHGFPNGILSVTSRRFLVRSSE